MLNVNVISIVKKHIIIERVRVNIHYYILFSPSGQNILLKVSR